MGSSRPLVSLLPEGEAAALVVVPAAAAVAAEADAAEVAAGADAGPAAGPAGPPANNGEAVEPVRVAAPGARAALVVAGLGKATKKKGGQI